MSEGSPAILLTEELLWALEEASEVPEEIIRLLHLSPEDITATFDIPWLTTEDRELLGVLLEAAHHLDTEVSQPSPSPQSSAPALKTRVSERTRTRHERRQIDLSVAVGRERLLQTHVMHGIALVDLVADRLPKERALEIYSRVARLSLEESRYVTSRILLSLAGRLTEPTSSASTESGGEQGEIKQDDENLHDHPRQFAGRVLRRIRGRVDNELRHRISLATARALDAVFETHVENAVAFSEMMPWMPLYDAIELYLDEFAIPAGISDVVYHRALKIATESEFEAAAPQYGKPVTAELGQ